jgi:small multidrug resistance pump
MRTWGVLLLAIACEVTATLALRAATDHAGWFVVVAVGYVAAFGALALLLRGGAAIGVIYGIWAALGVALTAVLAAVVFGDPLSWTMGLGIVLVMVGVVAVEGASGGHVAHGAEPRPTESRVAR